MRICLGVGLTLLVAGCGPRPYLPEPGCTYEPPASPYEIPIDNPGVFAVGNHEVVYEAVVDVLNDYFPIDREEPVRLIGNTLTEGRIETYPQVGATLLEPWHKDSANAYERLESTLQSIRRRAVARIAPTNGGYLVEVNVFKELEDLPQPDHANAGRATLRYDDTLTRVITPVAGPQASQGWISQGRDMALEQRIFQQLQMRLGRVLPPSAVQPQAAPGQCTTECATGARQ